MALLPITVVFICELQLPAARGVITVLLEKCSVMGSSWYFDETTDDPGQSSLDNISFNGQLVNAVGRMIYAGKLITTGSHH